MMSQRNSQFTPIWVRELNEELARELQRMEDQRRRSKVNEASVKEMLGRNLYRRRSGKSS